MSKNNFTGSAVNLARMRRCRQIARDLGFYEPDGPEGSMVHATDLLVLVVTDPEVSWRLRLRHRAARSGGTAGTYVTDTGYVDLSNLSEAQFRQFLLSALASVGIW